VNTLRKIVDFYRLQLHILRTWQPGTRALVQRGIVSFLVAFVAFALTIWIMPGISATNPGAIVAAVLVIGALNLIVRPLILLLFMPLGAAGVGLASILFQVAVILLANRFVPGLQVDGFWAAFWASWVFAILNTFLTAILAVNQDESYYGTLVRNLVTQRPDTIHSDQPGILIVQVDGLSRPVLQNQMRAGRVPFISKLVRSGSHRLGKWEAMLPDTTPASQAGIMHGNNTDIPAFRWYEKQSHRLLVANHPNDAAEIVRRMSNGEGLLSNNGASVGNLTSGDAVRSYLTMATIKEKGKGMGDSAAFYGFFLSPYNYLHMTVLFIAEIFKEVIQRTRGRRRGIEPFLDEERRLPYPFVRAATNVALRSLSTTLVMEEMYRGTPVIYVDYTDFDEIAHHSGPERPESLDALDGVDREIATLSRAMVDAPRPYKLVVVSDHGQSLGATFLQRYGVTLQDVVRKLMGGTASLEAATGQVEEWGPVNTFLSAYTSSKGVGPSIARAALRNRTQDGVVDVDPTEREAAKKAKQGKKDKSAPEEIPDLVVIGSGNLGLLYFNASQQRLTLEELSSLYPGLVDDLARHPGIGLLMVRSAAHGAMAIGDDGIRFLDEDRVEGNDPTAQYGPYAIPSLRRLDGFSNVGDIAAISLFDPETEEVAAFEELIGSHGGLGGWQTHGVLLYPSEWTIDEEPILGAPAVYTQLRRWIERAGTPLGRPAVAAPAGTEPAGAPPRLPDEPAASAPGASA